MNKNLLHEIKNLIIIAGAAVVYAIGISLFLDPNQLAPGGVTGIAVILNRLVNRDRYPVFSAKHTDCASWYLEVRYSLYCQNCLCHCDGIVFYESYGEHETFDR